MPGQSGRCASARDTARQHQLLPRVRQRLPRAGGPRRLRGAPVRCPGLLTGVEALPRYANRRGRASVQGFPLPVQRKPGARSGGEPCLPSRRALQAGAVRVHPLQPHHREHTGEHDRGLDGRSRKSSLHRGIRGWGQRCQNTWRHL